MIKEFQREHRWLSNFTPCVIIIDGVMYPSVEHAYQSQKNGNETWQHFCADPHNKPGEVKRKSRHVSLRKDWNDVKINIMYECLKQKYSDEPYMTKLINTGNETIQEGNLWHDTFWGVDLKTGIGENHLGKLIMQIRNELQQT